MKRIFFFSIIFGFFFTSCWNDAAFEKQDFIMGTIVSQRVHGASAEKAASEAVSRLKELEATLSFHAPDSDISKLNRSAGGPGIALSPVTIDLLDRSLAYARLTDGAFNIMVGPLVKRWRVTSDNPDVPPASEIAVLLRLISHHDLSVAKKRGTARLACRGQMVDLGGIAKGYASDEVIAIYKKHGVRSAIIDIGGNIGLLGSRPDGSPWRVGVQDPESERGACLGAISLKDKSVSTSGDYERFFMAGGRRYSHIINPRTGYPADSGLRSVTIIADSAVESDALSTAVFVAGLERGIALVKKFPGVQAVFITNERKIVATQGLKGVIFLTTSNRGFVVVYK